jgi:hypothetical protein
LETGPDFEKVKTSLALNPLLGGSEAKRTGGLQQEDFSLTEIFSFIQTLKER